MFSKTSIPTENGICPPGHRIDQDRCFACFPGSYTSGQDAECYLCPKDFYMEKRAADSCWPCPEGKKTLAQGADSEEACVYFDELGHPVPSQSPPWNVIFALVGLIIAIVWIIIIIILIRYWKNVDNDDSDQTEIIERGKVTRSSSKPLLTGSASDFTDSEDHIYAEIGDYEEEEDTYEVPIKPLHPPVYLDITPSIPEKKPRTSSVEVKLESSKDHVYELPPSEKISEDHTSEVPISERSDSHSYEIPIQRSFKPADYVKRSASDAKNIYDEVTCISDEDEIDEALSKTRSKGFDPTPSLKEGVRKEPLESRRQSERKSRLSDISQLEKPKSDEKMVYIPEEENECDVPSEDTHFDEFYDESYDEEAEMDWKLPESRQTDDK